MDIEKQKCFLELPSVLLHVYGNLGHESGVQQLVHNHRKTLNAVFINVALDCEDQ